MKKSRLNIFLAFFILTTFIVYVGYQVFSWHLSSIEVETAISVNWDEDINVNAFIVRDEILIPNNTGGVVSCLLENGEKIAAGGIIAESYSNEASAVNNHRLHEIEDEINILNHLNSFAGSISTTPEAINKQLAQETKLLLNNINEANYKKLGPIRKNILYLLSEYKIISEQESTFFKRISDLEKQKSDIEIALIQKTNEITSPISGYFVKNIDGYEKIINYNDVLSTTISTLNQSRKKQSFDNSAFIGKIVGNQDWYAIFEMSKEDADKLSSENELKISLPFVYSGYLIAKVVSINQENKNDNALVTIKCDYINEDLTNIRNESIKLIFNTHTGIRIPKKALHEQLIKKDVENDQGQKTSIEKKVQGVFVIQGNRLIFKEIVCIFADKDYIICDPNPSTELLFSHKNLKIHDKIVTEGYNLYDGKIVKQ